MVQGSSLWNNKKYGTQNIFERHDCDLHTIRFVLKNDLKRIEINALNTLGVWEHVTKRIDNI